MTTTPFIKTVERTRRIAGTATPSAASLSPRPIQADAAIAAASVARTRPRASLRSGGSGSDSGTQRGDRAEAGDN
jgi:hypothetical protein